MLQMIISERITYMLLTAITIDDINDNVVNLRRGKYERKLDLRYA
jgi:hypothetical protein